MKVYDANKTGLHAGDAVMCIINGTENEGVVLELLPENKLKVDGESGVITVNGTNCFYLP